MPRTYTHLTTQDRAIVMTMRDDLCSIRCIAKRLCRSASTISRELRRTSGTDVYYAGRAHRQAEARRVAPRRIPKMHPDGTLFLVVRLCLQLRWSPQQIAAILKSMWPDDASKTVSHETIITRCTFIPEAN